MPLTLWRGFARVGHSSALRWGLSNLPAPLDQSNSTQDDDSIRRSAAQVRRTHGEGSVVMVSRWDFAIVGAGIVGCSIAFELARAGMQVCVLERGGIGEESSAAAAGMLSGQHGVTNLGDRYRLHVEARELHAQLAGDLRERTGIDVGFCRWGLLELLFTPGEVRAADRCCAIQTQAGLRVERLSREETLALEPALAPDLQGSIRYVDEAHVHNGRLTIALAEAARRTGAELRSGAPALALIRERERVVGIQTPTETVYA